MTEWTFAAVVSELMISSTYVCLCLHLLAVL